MCTPVSAKPLQSQAKSTIKKTAYVTPSHGKPSTVQPSSVLKSNKKFAVKGAECGTQALPSNDDRVCEADFNYPETKSYKNKTLDMR